MPPIAGERNLQYYSATLASNHIMGMWGVERYCWTKLPYLPYSTINFRDFGKWNLRLERVETTIILVEMEFTIANLCFPQDDGEKNWMYLLQYIGNEIKSYGLSFRSEQIQVYKYCRLYTITRVVIQIIK